MSVWAVSGRILWKEYRHQRLFWLGLLVLGAALQGLVWVLMEPGEDRTAALVHLALGFPVCYMVGSLAMLFAGESEAGTAAFLRNVAVPRWPLVLTKLVFAVTTGAALWVPFMLVGLILVGPRAWLHQSAVDPVNLLFGVGLLAWGWLWSMLSSRTLSAICWTLASFIVTILLAAAGERNVSGFVFFGACGMALITSALLVNRWGEPIRFSLHNPLARLTARRRARLWQQADEAAGWRRTWRRLKWKERRAAALTWWLLGLGLIVVLIGASWERYLDIPFALGTIAFIPALLGIASYQGEHTRMRHGFLADHAVGPAALWLAKQRVWLPRAVLVPMALATVYAAWNGSIDGPDGEFIARIGLWSLLAYGIGQMLALLIPQSAVAVVVGILVLSLTGFWWAEMRFLRVPLFWAASLVAAWTLLVTLIRLPDWLDPRRDWRSRVRIAAVLTVPPVLLITGYALYRIEEVPSTPAPPPLAELLKPQSAEDRQVARMVQRASELLIGSIYLRGYGNPEQIIEGGWDTATEPQKQALRTNEEALRLLVQAARHDEAVIFEDPYDMAYDLTGLTYLLLFSARRLEADGELDTALERYLAALRLARFTAVNGGFRGRWNYGRHYEEHVLRWLRGWAMHPDQTPERIREGIARVAAELERYPDLMTAVALDYYANLHHLEESAREIADEAYEQEGALGALRAELTATWLPWERVRAERVFRREWNRLAFELEPAIAGLHQPGYELNRELLRERLDEDVQQRKREIMTTPLAIAGIWGTARGRLHWLGWIIERQRAALLTLDLIAWRLEHGTLPERLDELAGVAPPLRLIDPWSGRLFQYAPHGLPTPLTRETAETRDAVGQPVLWSVGLNAVRLVPVETPDGVAYRFTRPYGNVAVPHFYAIPTK